MQPVFLSGQWQKLIMINYAVDPEILIPLLPPKTVLKLWNNTCYVTLAGFLFSGIKAAGMPIPFHRNITEVNLRFYVVPEGRGERERGVVFIREIVAKPFIAFAANLLYKEKYKVSHVNRLWNTHAGHQRIAYQWRTGASLNTLAVEADLTPLPTPHNSEEEFITLQYRGYTRAGENKTLRYIVEHPAWNLYNITSHTIEVDFEASFGNVFAFLNAQQPVSIYLAEGSDIKIRLREEMKE